MNSHDTLPDLSDITQGSLRLKFANSESEIIQSQRLRYKIFYEELRADADEQSRMQKRDIDPYDEISDHLLVLDTVLSDNEAEQLVGSYRLITQNKLAAGQKFYTENEYDISALKNSNVKLLELGRSYVREEYRTKQVINLLWHGLARYINHYDIGCLFGCASFYGADPEKHRMALSLLHSNNLAPEKFRPAVLPSENAVAIEALPADSDIKNILRDIPPLLKGYIRVGGYIGDGAYIDKKFDTVDVCVVVLIAEISPRYFNHFLRSEDES